MRCFNHPTYEAAGVCRHCGRGICHDCIAIVEEAVACKDKCEARVAIIQRMIRSNPRQLQQGGTHAIFSGLVFGVLGAIFIGFVGGDFGLYVGASFIALGLLIIVRGLSALRASRSMVGQNNPVDGHNSAGMGQFK